VREMKRLVSELRARDPGHRHRSDRYPPHRARAGALRHRFAQRVLVEQEYQRFCAHAKPPITLPSVLRPRRHSPKRWHGIHFPVNWHNVSVANERSGKPYLVFRNHSRSCSRRGIRRTHLSLSDEVEMASAFVILEGDERE